MQSYGPVHPRSSISREADERADGTLSDTAIGSITEQSEIPFDQLSESAGNISESKSGKPRSGGLTKNKTSSSTSQLSVSGNPLRNVA